MRPLTPCAAPARVCAILAQATLLLLACSTGCGPQPPGTVLNAINLDTWLPDNGAAPSADEVDGDSSGGTDDSDPATSGTVPSDLRTVVNGETDERTDAPVLQVNADALNFGAELRALEF